MLVFGYTNENAKNKHCLFNNIVPHIAAKINPIIAFFKITAKLKQKSAYIKQFR